MQPKIGYLYEERDGWDDVPTQIEFIKEGEERRWDSRKRTRIVYWEVPEVD